MAGKTIKALIAVILIVALGRTALHSSEITPPQPTARDKCPVCGMFVAKYPDWLTTVVFKDGAGRFFDGVKDFFKYYFNMATYESDRQTADIAAIKVTEYYDMKLIAAQEAYFVLGSDVYGPMGRELIPFKSEADARQFMADHSGQRLVRFAEVSAAMIAELD